MHVVLHSRHRNPCAAQLAIVSARPHGNIARRDHNHQLQCLGDVADRWIAIVRKRSGALEPKWLLILYIILKYILLKHDICVRGAPARIRGMMRIVVHEHPPQHASQLSHSNDMVNQVLVNAHLLWESRSSTSCCTRVSVTTMHIAPAMWKSDHCWHNRLAASAYISARCGSATTLFCKALGCTTDAASIINPFN